MPLSSLRRWAEFGRWNREHAESWCPTMPTMPRSRAQATRVLAGSRHSRYAVSALLATRQTVEKPEMHSLCPSCDMPLKRLIHHSSWKNRYCVVIICLERKKMLHQILIEARIPKLAHASLLDNGCFSSCKFLNQNGNFVCFICLQTNIWWVRCRFLFCTEPRIGWLRDSKIDETWKLLLFRPKTVEIAFETAQIFLDTVFSSKLIKSDLPFLPRPIPFPIVGSVLSYTRQESRNLWGKKSESFRQCYCKRKERKGTANISGFQMDEHQGHTTTKHFIRDSDWNQTPKVGEFFAFRQWLFLPENFWTKTVILCFICLQTSIWWDGFCRNLEVIDSALNHVLADLEIPKFTILGSYCCFVRKLLKTPL